MNREDLEKIRRESDSFCFPKDDLPIKKGDRVRVPKGVKLRSMHPQRPTEYEAGKSYHVEVHHVVVPLFKLKATSNEEWSLERDPRVVWAGSGGYWVEASLFDVVLT